ncbi:hypothetical protein Emag_004384 [Eimeria magna]
MRAALAHHGPVSVAIQADQLDFQFYKSGVFDAPCGSSLDHGVLLVGYGTDKKSNKDFFLMKNSWGPGWGEGGYMLMAQHKGRTMRPSALGLLSPCRGRGSPRPSTVAAVACQAAAAAAVRHCGSSSSSSSSRKCSSIVGEADSSRVSCRRFRDKPAGYHQQQQHEQQQPLQQQQRQQQQQQGRELRGFVSRDFHGFVVAACS